MLIAALVTLSVAAASPPALTIDAVAGSYYQGDGLGLNWQLDIRKDGTFSFAWDGCLGRYQENDGDVRLTSEHLELIPKKPMDEVPVQWTLIPWGDRMYLVDEKRMPRFVQYANLGWEPRSAPLGSFFIRQTDLKRKTSGRPSLPERWARLLILERIDARVSRVQSPRRAEIDAGQDKHLVVGMRLMAVGRHDWTTVEVQSVAEHSAIVEVAEDEIDPEGLSVRERVTSRPK